MNRRTTKGSGHAIKPTKRGKPKPVRQFAELCALNDWLWARETKARKL